MIQIDLDINRVLKFVSKEQIYAYQETISRNHQNLLAKKGKGDDFLGWVDLPSQTRFDFLDEIKADADKIAKKAKVFVVIGIGGSYLGARAVIESLQHQFSPFMQKDRPQIVYAGQNISEDYMVDLMELLENQDYAVTIISKSGTTTEPALAFRIIKNHLEAKYGKAEAAERIIAITDKEKGALKTLADKEGYKTYVVPDDVGGRYSVLTPVGLLPIAVAGFDIHELLKGAVEMEKFNRTSADIDKNPMALYAATRNALYNTGKTTEIMVNYLPNLYYMTEWWKQLYGESEGKENKGIFPAGVSNTTDLHSMGQYIQEGLRNIFETVISVEKSHRKLEIPMDMEDLDGLNYLEGKSITEVNHNAQLGTTLAHVDGGVPNLKISIPQLNENNLGQLIYFYEFACGLSGYVLDVNPFDQPGVEAYKKNMFALLGKPGFEKETQAIRAKI
ncbi:MAG: glucose-6-phosphate isomerase [Bacteroidetes bacterium 4572_77]|nr:MAG: glucose-6-phosphate isomerase [Bacteroidetes bacterium 4572_77]